MIAFEVVLQEVGGVHRTELQQWIEARWILPERRAEGYFFHEIDVARIRLILELRQQLMIDDEAMPVVLNLLDQIYSLRCRLKSIATAVENLPPDIQKILRATLGE